MSKVKKICKICKIEKDIDEFYLVDSISKYIRGACKICCLSANSKRQKGKYRNRKEYMNKYIQQRGEKEPWYKSLIFARSRCSDKTNNWYKKGIKVYITLNELKKIWFRDKAWLLDRPSLDRIDNNGDYTFKNCRYIEQRENSRRGGLCNRKIWR